jgi:hypothetical protein
LLPHRKQQAALLSLFQYNVLPFSFKGLSKFRITRARANVSKHLSFEGLFVVVQFTPGIYKSDPGLPHKGALLLPRKPGIQILKGPAFTDKLS